MESLGIEKTLVGIPLKFGTGLGAQFFNFAGNDVINLIAQNNILVTGISSMMQLLDAGNTPYATFNFALAVDVVSPSIYQTFGVLTGSPYPVNSERFYFSTWKQLREVSFYVPKGQQFQVNPTLGSISATTGATDQIAIQTYMTYKEVF